MKNDIRMKAIRMSNAAILSAALAITGCFTGCSKSDSGKGDKDSLKINSSSTTETGSSVSYEEVNKDNLQSFESVILGNKGTITSNFSPYFFDYKPDPKKLKESQVGISTSVGNIGSNRIYKHDNGDYVTIDNGEALKLVESSEGVYRIGKTETFDGGYTLINEEGEVTIVFSDKEALDKFASELSSNLNQTTDGLNGIVNGFKYTSGIKCETINLVEKEENFYNAGVVIESINGYLEFLGEPFQKIEYSEDKDEIVVKRTTYRKVDEEVQVAKIEIHFPIGENGSSYYDSKYNIILGYSYKSDSGEVMMSETALRELLGIDVTKSQFTIPSTEETIEDILCISTGNDANVMVDQNIVLMPEDEFEEKYGYPVNEYPSNYDPCNTECDIVILEENADAASENSLSSMLSKKFKTPITITKSDPAEQADELLTQLQAAYPDIPWIGGHGSYGVAVDTADYINYTITDEECQAPVEEYLAGRSVYDLNPSELWPIVEYSLGYWDITEAFNNFGYTFPHSGGGGGSYGFY